MKSMKKNPKVLTGEEIMGRLDKLSGWQYRPESIFKEFKFPDFLSALEFINELAPFCETANHHPDIHLFYGRIIFELKTYDAGERVTDRDFMVAEEIERIYAEEGGQDKT